MATKSYVRESSDGAWEVLPEGHRRAQVRSDTKEKAVAKAREIVRRRGGGEVRVLNRSGKIVASKTVRKTRAKPLSKRAGKGQGRAAS
jgi:hypothetical protein